MAASIEPLTRLVAIITPSAGRSTGRIETPTALLAGTSRAPAENEVVGLGPIAQALDARDFDEAFEAFEAFEGL